MDAPFDWFGQSLRDIAGFIGFTGGMIGLGLVWRGGARSTRIEETLKQQGLTNAGVEARLAAQERAHQALKDDYAALNARVATREDVRQAVQDLKGDLAERLTDLREAITSRPRRRQEGA